MAISIYKKTEVIHKSEQPLSIYKRPILPDCSAKIRRKKSQQ